jgi:dihydropyrimidinase/allantoinase
MIMSSIDLAIKGGKIVTPEGIFGASIGVNRGKIVTIAKEGYLPPADQVIDVKGNFVLPGVIDAHTHLREPGMTIREDFETGTKAAAASGVTTVFEMPLAIPCVATAEILQQRREIVEKRAVVDFGLYGGAGMHNIDKIPELAECGAIGFKTFLHAPPEGRDIEFEGAYATDDGALFEILTAVATTGLVSSIHAENNAIIQVLTQKLKECGRKDAMAHSDSRPNFVEAETISSVIILANAAGARLHIAHLSTKEGLNLIRQAKKNGQKITVETCPHYLTLTANAMKKFGPYVKINPPLRSEEDVIELWKGLNDNSIDMVVSDHAPYTKEEKDPGWIEIWKAQSGAPTIETLLPLLLNKVNEGKLALETLVRVTSEKTAKVFGVYPRKGAIKLGSDADLVIVDLNKIMTIDKGKMYSKARELTPYHGWRVRGWPIMTIVRGCVVMKEGEVVGKPGYGEFISPQRS